VLGVRTMLGQAIRHECSSDQMVCRRRLRRHCGLMPFYQACAVCPSLSCNFRWAGMALIGQGHSGDQRATRCSAKKSWVART
jgi:RNA polymerase subunit RPABC4/transcription elongation factor Spt4